MAEQEVLATIMHMARQLIWLDMATICGYVGAMLNVGVVMAMVVRRSRKGKEGRNGAD